MKVAIALLALMALATAAEYEKQPYASVSDKVTQLIEDIRDQMPCGFPSKGIPPLAPLNIKHQKVSKSSKMLNVTGSISDFYLYGLNDFTIDLMKINLVLEKASFRFTFNNINIDTLYNLDLALSQSGITLIAKGDGRGQFAVKNLVIDGTAKFSFSLLTQKLKLKKFLIHLKVGDIKSNIDGLLGKGKINSKMNSVLEEIVQYAINSNDEFISTSIEEAVVPAVNEFLADKKIGDLVGGGGSGGEKVPCNPSKYYNDQQLIH